MKLIGAKILSLGAKPENQKMISNETKRVKEFIGNGPRKFLEDRSSKNLNHKNSLKTFTMIRKIKNGLKSS